MFKNATQGYFILHWAHLYRFDPGINLIKRGRRTLLSSMTNIWDKTS